MQSRETYGTPTKEGMPLPGNQKPTMPQSNAERQAKYRENKRLGTKEDLGGRRLDCWVSSEAFFALNRIARQQKKTKQQILEALIIATDEENLKACLTDEELDEYLASPGNESKK